MQILYYFLRLILVNFHIVVVFINISFLLSNHASYHHHQGHHDQGHFGCHGSREGQYAGGPVALETGQTLALMLVPRKLDASGVHGTGQPEILASLEKIYC